MIQNWFEESKLGIFIHWGIYAVDGVWESWALYMGELTPEEYFSQLKGFTAEKYNPDEWATLFKEIGADYVVLTAKHADGVALFDTKMHDLNVVKKTPAGRDLIAPYCEAVRKAGMKVGLYFSHMDWSHPDYPSVFHEHDKEREYHPFNKPNNGVDDYEGWERFLKFHRGQLKELMTNYGDIDLIWFDGHWERSAKQWDMKGLRDFMHELNPKVILNSRMYDYGDFESLEQGVPIIAPDKEWEFCMTINDSWGYRLDDNNYKSLRQIIRIFSECISMGGRLLLDVGPKPDGTLDQRQIDILKGLGKWIKENEEAVKNTKKGLGPQYFYGGSTLSKDNKNVYLHFYYRTIDYIAVKGIKNKINKVTILKNGKELNFRIFNDSMWCGVPGVLLIDLDDSDIDENVTVIKVELDGELDLYGSTETVI